MKGKEVPPNTFAFASTLADRHGELVEKLEQLLPLVAARFDTLAVVATDSTDARALASLASVGAHVLIRPPSTDAIGLHRREALALALTHAPGEHILYADLDHILRWLETDPDELDRLMHTAAAFDCFVIGRGPTSWERLPRRLAATESIVNEVYALMTGRKWDLLMAARVLSARAAEEIVTTCRVDTMGNDADWPLRCEAHGMTLGYAEADGLTYRTNRDYAGDLEDSLDHDPHAWAMRVRIVWQCLDAMAPYMSPPLHG